MPADTAEPPLIPRSAIPGCLIVTGVPGAGKTTITTMIARRFDRSARLDGDTVNEMIVSGGVGVDQLPDPDAQAQLLLRARNLCSLADNFDDDGFLPVIDHVIPDRAVLEFMLSELTVRPVHLVVLAPRPEVAWERNVGRPADERVLLDLEPLQASMQAELADVGWWIDSSDQTPEGTVELLIREVTRHGVVSR